MKRLTTIRSGAVYLALGILGFTAVLKLWSLQFPAHDSGVRLWDRNLVFPFFSEGEVMFLAALLELAVTVLLLRARSGWLKFGVLAWLTLAFGFYHATMTVFGQPCHCAGFVASKSFLDRPEFTTVLLIGLGASAAVGLAVQTLIKFGVRNSEFEMKNGAAA